MKVDNCEISCAITQIQNIWICKSCTFSNYHIKDPKCTWSLNVLSICV